VVGSGASIKRSILWDRVFVDGKSALRGAVVCSKTRIRQESELYEGSVVGADCTLGKGCLVKPQVKIWPGKTIDSGSQLSASLVWGQRCSGSLLCSQGVLGLVNVELTPSTVARLGMAWGNTLKAGDSVQISCDGEPAGKMLKRALIAGALSAGVQVTDLGTLPVPAARLAVTRTKAKAAAYLGMAHQAENALLLQFFGHNGLSLGTVEQRKLESCYQREEFRLGKIGEVQFQPGALESYLEQLLVSLPPIKRERIMEPVVAVPKGILAQFTSRFLSALGVGSLILEEERPSSEEKGWLSAVQLCQMVLEHKAPFGVRIEAGGERLLLVDEDGSPVSRELMWAVLAKLALAGGQRKLAAPVTAPNVLEEIAQEYDGTVTRTASDTRSILEEQMAENQENLFFPVCDAFAFLGQLLAYLSQGQSSLSQLLGQIPSFHRSQRKVSCPWELRGKVMRRLVEQEHEQLDLVDGIKIPQNIGWALVLPDEKEPYFQVYSEAQSQEEADLLAAAYMERIGAFQED
jgi:mannose-1-phosphate guanylyltransferase/phosphomannomutase